MNVPEPHHLGSALERLLGHLGAPPVRTVSELGERWAEIVGPALCSHSRPAGLVDGVLRVQCDDEVWASQVKWMDGQIKESFARIFPGTDLRAIRVGVGS
jgi:predicted nucleic acid-binding Zn ribbon protein